MIFGKFERLMAGRYLRAKRKEGFISVITGFAFTGIALGVATLIIVMSVMNGFRSELLGRILGINGHIGIMAPTSYPFNNYRKAVEEISEIEHITTVIPMIENQLLVTAGRSAEGAMVRGIAKDDMLKKEAYAKAIDGVDMNYYQDGGVIMGMRLARKMGLTEGDNITLLSPNGKITAFGTVPRMKSYQIIGLFDSGMFEYDSNFIFMPLESAQVYFGLKGAVTNIDVTLDDDKYLTAVRGALEKSLGGSAYVYDWKQSNAAFFNAIDVERNVMFVILTLIILVAAFNIITGLIMLVKDKGRDIAVLRTMGATKGMVMRIFFIDGAGIGIIGTALGVVLGLAVCDNIEAIRQGLQYLFGRDLFSAEIYFLSKLPAKVDPIEVVSVVAISLLLSFAATLYPSWRAARMDPVEALRYE
ncbi:MAG: lipoprotein-releasing ABC transporter permease subunit [Alphaproteobacteria bacterium]|nr:lipoprotein-releasing ABC transporter permease subunit [Alphaproteobacteria bacterium]